MMQIPVLTYHSNNVDGNEYHNNDHVAFELDLQLISKLGYEIISTHELVSILKEKAGSSKKKYVCLTFDDGSDMDYHDWEHPFHGYQKSFLTMMQDFKNETGQNIHATSFVIADPQARAELTNTCTAGYPIWNSDWWKEAEKSGMLSIENHSWDHVHSTLKNTKTQKNIKGDFSGVDSFLDAKTQIAEASRFINSVIVGKKISLFAYPYGHFNDYLVKQYFPYEQSEIIAAFTCEPQFVTQDTNLWLIPRFVCGSHWKSSNGLRKILQMQS